MLSVSGSNSLSLRPNSTNEQQNSSQQVRKFLRFYLGGDSSQNTSMANSDLALLEAEIVTEVITISAKELLVVPQMPYCVLGIHSWRSEMLWIVDLENLLGYPPALGGDIDEDEDCTLLVMVVQSQGQSMGLVVSRIDNIIEQDVSKFKPSSAELFSEDIMPFLHGYFTDEQNNIVMMIDAEEVFNFFSINPSFNNYQ